MSPDRIAFYYGRGIIDRHTNRMAALMSRTKRNRKRKRKKSEKTNKQTNKQTKQSRCSPFPRQGELGAVDCCAGMVVALLPGKVALRLWRPVCNPHRIRTESAPNPHRIRNRVRSQSGQPRKSAPDPTRITSEECPRPQKRKTTTTTTRKNKTKEKRQ